MWGMYRSDTVSNQLSPEALATIEKVRLMLETKGCTEEEAATRSAVAMRLLAKHNLDMAMVSDKKIEDSVRHDMKKSGGLYQWQRDLWKSVAKLNFCIYFSIKGLTKGSTYQNRVIGRQENVIATEVMAGYLQQTVDRLAQDWAKSEGRNVFCREAIAYREGMADRLCARLREVREERIREDEAKQRAEAARARHPSSAPGTALVVLSAITSAEADLNEDYLNGYPPGTTARRRAEWERREAENAAAREKWKRDNPELWAAEQAEAQAANARYYAEAEKRERERIKRAERAGRDPDASQYRAQTAREARSDLNSYWEGRAKADDIGLDQQVEKKDHRKIG